MIIDENLSEAIFEFWQSKTTIAIDLDLLLEDFKYQSTFSIGTFFILPEQTNSGLIEFFFYDYEIKNSETYFTTKGANLCTK